MKKSFRISCLLVFLTSPLMLLAQQVSSELAKQKALTFLTKSDKSSTKRSASNKTPRLVLANDRDEFYAFNDEANGGYVVVSGDERMPDVLGYSYTGHFDAETIPCNMRAWLEGYANQVIYLREHPEVPASRRSMTEREEISPLLKCHFDQGKYYNEKCPIVDGDHAVTGCVATAMAQIMYYYQWPKQTTDIIPGYTSETRKINLPAIPVTAIDWENMLEKYDSEEDYSDKQIEAISTLMMLCGTSVKMDYATEEGSGSTLLNAAKALRKYFEYDYLAEYVTQGKSDIWEQRLYDELKSGRPVLYEGEPFKVINSHAFVLDGYRDGYFHVNWGWGGSYDDYFLLTDLVGYIGYNYKSRNGAVIGIQPACPDSPSRYAVLDSGKITLYYDKEISHRTGTILPDKDEWLDYAKQATECVIDSSFANLEMNNLSFFFFRWSKIKSITGLENLNTSKVTDMSYMFQDCSSLTSLDVSGLNTENVKDMRSMFYNCSSLKNLELSGFKTDEVIYMNSMFQNCSSLTNLDLSGFKTDKLGYVNSMFQSCSSLKNLDLSSFNTYYVSDMNNMFNGCSGLTDLDVSGFKTDYVLDMGYMFSGCSKLTSLDVSGFKTDNVRNMAHMFSGCSNLTSLDVSGFNTFDVTDMERMFSGCSNLTTIYANDHWNMSNVLYADDMFEACYSLIGGAGTAYNNGSTTISVIAEKDWTGGFEGEYPYWYQFDDSQTNGSVTSNPDGIAIYVDKTVGMYWEPQVMVIPDGSFNLKQGGSYKVVVTAKFPTNGTLQINMGIWDNYDQTTVDVVSTGDFQEIEVLFPNFAYNIEDCHLLFQCGDFKGTTIMKKIQVLDMNDSYVEGNSGGDYAHIDGGSDNPGYFTHKDSKFHTISYMIDGKVYMIRTYKYGDHIVYITPPYYREGYEFAWIDLPETMPDHDITIYGSYTLGIKDLQEEKHPVKVFSLEGKAQNKMQKGINIIRYSDGSVRKVLVK